MTTTPTTQNPTHHVTLTDGVDTLSFILVDGSGQPNPRAISRSSVTRTAVKTYSGNGKWDDFEPPFVTAAQDDWSGGRGGEIFENDTSRYADGYGVQFAGGKLTLGPQVTFASGHRNQNQAMPTRTTVCDWDDLYSSTRYMSQSFVASANYTAKNIQVWAKYIGTSPGSIYAAIYSNNAGVPDAVLASGWFASTLIDDSVSKLVNFDLGAGTALTSGTTYHVVIYGASTADATSHWKIMSNGSPSGSNDSSDGTSWSAAENSPFYRVLDDVTRYSGRGIFFEYKGSEYLVTQPDDATLKSYLYMNGDRGAADSNAGNLDRLIDNSKAASAWSDDEWNGCIVRVIAGPGSNEAQPWREIVDTVVSGGNAYLVVDANWKVEHTTATEYVIVKSDVWQNKQDLGYYCTDVAVAGENVYFAFGDYSTSNVIKRYREYNLGGTWTEVTPVNDVVKAQNLCAIRHPELDTMVLYGSQHHHPLYGVCLWRGLVPLAWGDLYNDLGALAGTAKPWDGDTGITNVTQGLSSGDTLITIAAGFTTGVVAEEDITADVTTAKKIAVLAKSSVATAAADLDWQLYDGANTINIDIPAITVADTWTWLVSSFSPADTASAVYSSIDAVRLVLGTDLGAQTITMHGGVRLLGDDLEYIDFPNNSRINKIVPYGGSQTEPRRNPWVLTEGLWYEVQTQNSDAVVPIPLDEMETIKDYRTGKASGVNDVYLYSNMGMKFERYFGRNLDDLGPDLDGGLPSNCTGELAQVLSLPGTVLLVIDGGEINYSNILMLRGSAWHSFYRSPHQAEVWNNRIRSVGVQSIPGLNHIWIWAVMGDSIIRLPYGFNAFRDDDYPMTHEGVLETPWITGNMMAVKKVWKSLSVFGTFGNDTALPYVEADYKTTEYGAWTALADYFGNDTEEQNLATTLPSSRRIKLRFRMQGFYSYNDAYKPLMDAWVLDYYAHAPNKRAYTFTALLVDEDDIGGGVNLDMEHEYALGYAARVEDAQTKLDTWSDAATPLTMRNLFSVMDSKTVVLSDVPIQPLDLNWKGQVERHILQITVNEL